MSPQHDRAYDVTILGATGFTGELTAAYLAEHAPDGLRWALAGRNATKLAGVRDRLAARHPAAAQAGLVEADVADAASMRALAESTRVLVTTVGPYLEHGEAAVAACAAAGTDYLDLTGEPEFVDRMYLAHHEQAVASGARLVHACGFDSIPHDLGALYTVRALAPDGATEPVRLQGVVRAGARFSGGTFHSAIEQFGRSRQMRRALSERRRRERRPEGRRSRAIAGRPHRDSELGWWLLPLPTIDPLVIARSGAALSAYGPDFGYSHYAGVRRLSVAVGGVAGMGSLVAAAQVPPVRRALGRLVERGQGPSQEQRDRSWFTVDFRGESAGRTVRTRVSGGDPGYTETAKMLAEAALCLALDDNPPTSGQVTTAAAMGEALLGRLQAAGLRFETLG